MVANIVIIVTTRETKLSSGIQKVLSYLQFFYNYAINDNLNK